MLKYFDQAGKPGRRLFELFNNITYSAAPNLSSQRIHNNRQVTNKHGFFMNDAMITSLIWSATGAVQRDLALKVATRFTNWI